VTLLTATLIANDPEVFASCYGPMDGKYGLYIGTLDEMPSGCKRPRDLVSSEPVYLSTAKAISAAQGIIDGLRNKVRRGLKTGKG
jgi:hypothetical protein